jgi:hypothetical protein
MAACICVALATVGARAAEPSAKPFVESIYAAYKGKDSKGISLETDAAVRRYFDPKLAALIIKDREDAKGEVGKLGSDPFIDAQDWEIDALDVAMRTITPGKAVATISFKSLGNQDTIVLDLVKLKTGWRIADIRSRNGSLRAFLSKK